MEEWLERHWRIAAAAQFVAEGTIMLVLAALAMWLTYSCAVSIISPSIHRFD